MRLLLLHEAAPNQIHRAGPTIGPGKRFADLRSALNLIYGEPGDTKDGQRRGAGRPTLGTGQLPSAYTEPGSRAADPHGTGGASAGIPWKPRHRKFLGVNPSA